jgi:uncharacterized protein YggU (UPF0235/DUF167 family)
MADAGARRQAMRRMGNQLILQVRLKPKSARNEIEGMVTTVEGTVIGARVRALPHDNLANEALEKLVAGWLHVPRTSVSLTSGGRGRLKTICVTGDVTEIERRLTERLGHLVTRQEPHPDAERQDHRR